MRTLNAPTDKQAVTPSLKMAVSPESLADHRRLYDKYVCKAREQAEKLRTIQMNCRKAIPHDVANLKQDHAYVLAAIQNHDLYFPILSDKPTQPCNALLDAIVQSFGSLDAYKEDLRQTALSARGWVWTVLCLDSGKLWNLGGAQTGQVPFWKAAPLLAIDLYEHAYFLDYGNHRAAYIDAVLAHLNFSPVDALFHQAQRIKLAMAS
ncbi:MAG: superoxide dismutase [Phycisphaerae bacterium]